MKRLPNWERALSDYLRSMADAQYEYGRLDCGLFVAGAVLAMTGDDPAAAFRGKYNSVTGAAKALKRIGAGDLKSTLDRMFDRKEPSFAHRGDLIWNGEAVGVCAGAYALFIAAAGQGGGLVRVPRADWRGAWAV